MIPLGIMGRVIFPIVVFTRKVGARARHLRLRGVQLHVSVYSLLGCGARVLIMVRERPTLGVILLFMSPSSDIERRPLGWSLIRVGRFMLLFMILLIKQSDLSPKILQFLF